MPHSIIDSSYTGSSRSHNQSLTPSPISTAPTSRSTSPNNLLSKFSRKPSVPRRPPIQPRKSSTRSTKSATTPRSQPGDWNQLLGVQSTSRSNSHSNTSSRRSSLHVPLPEPLAQLTGQGIQPNTQSQTHLQPQSQSQPKPKPQPQPQPHKQPMGGNRTSVNMNGALDSKRRTTSYEEQYQYKDNTYGSARERVHRESPVIAELRTNVIIKDEFTLVTDMSYHLAARYSRPDSSIMINVDHSSCLALAGTFEPCYILTISVVPSQMQATTNKRNAALIQSFMADILSVPPERGIIKFVPVPEENYAINGNTLFGEIERLEQQQFGNGAVKRAITDVRKSMPAFNAKRSNSKIDADAEFARKVDQADGFDGHLEELKSIVPAPLQKQRSIPDVFELAGTGNGDQRPSTSHGSGTNGSFAALNGLRLNGVANSDLEGPDTRTSYGRPKTIAGGPVWPPEPSAEEFSLLPRRGSDDGGAPAPTVRSNAKDQPAKDQRKSTLPDFKTGPGNSTSTQQKPTSIPTTTSSATEKTQPAYLENPPKSALSKGHSRNKSQSPPEALPTPQTPQDDGTAAANTAKRRSTVGATPATNNKVPQPPPIPESKQAKVSKRKSFLSAFRSK